ncbi:hypothetical protein [Sulfurimonas sp.]|uniref:hypothetical protein n=1 Tax=Sulfurimonas sp. TaxID=2022749 RepID=UPI0025CC6C49|nr:hypothetical protein [Sulfurimonas sp.]MDD5157858.1 hypothetical protein [Sulfurimonas sp.]
MVKIALFFNDGGPSNNLISIIKRYEEDYEWHLFAFKESPAWLVFEKANLGVCIKELDKDSDIKQELLFLKPAVVLVGTSWQNRTHLEFIKVAKTLHIPSVAMLEHWVNYRERFGYPDKNYRKNISDFITVNDIYGYEMADDLGFANIIKLRFYNLLDDIEIFENTQIKEQNSLLFISEPTKKVALNSYGNENYWGFDEFEVYEEICENMELFGTNELNIRLHPSDEIGKYDYLTSRYKNIKIEIENPYETALISSLCKNKIIIGIDGFVLFEAMLLGKLSLSLMPPSKRECVVPIFEQNKIRAINKNMKLSDFKRALSVDEIKSFGIDFATMIKQIVK